MFLKYVIQAALYLWGLFWQCLSCEAMVILILYFKYLIQFELIMNDSNIFMSSSPSYLKYYIHKNNFGYFMFIVI